MMAAEALKKTAAIMVCATPVGHAVTAAIFMGHRSNGEAHLIRPPPQKGTGHEFVRS
jgi:hypothetical protein